MSRLLVAFVIAAAITPHFAHAAQSQSAKERTLRIQQEKHAELQQKFEKQVDEIVEWCNDKGLVDAAKQTRVIAALPDPRTLSEAKLPREVQPLSPPGAIDDQRTWHVKLETARNAYAKELYRLSRTVLRLEYPSYAMSLVQEVAHHDPDHKNARRLLGYVLFKDKKRKEAEYMGEWVTPFEKKMLGSLKRKVWNTKYGWIPESEVSKYDQGLRPWKGSWITVEKDNQIRRDFRNAWEIETEHFIVKTNFSMERGVQIASELEEFYAFFKRTFASFFETPEELRNRFVGKARNRGRATVPKQMEVHYYRTKEEYVDRLIKKIPQIAITEGLYYEPDKTTYFYHDPDRETDGTLFHEATHQFFDLPTRDHRVNAARARARALRSRVMTNWVMGENANFWMIEAIACYMESFEATPTGYALGNPNYIRFRAAHFRLTNNEYYVPLRQFSGMGMKAFQSDPNIAMNYTQGSGLAHFLMHYDGGKYRDGLVGFIADMYRPDLKNPLQEPSLEKATGTTFVELDKQYKEYMSNLYSKKQVQKEPAASQ